MDRKQFLIKSTLGVGTVMIAPSAIGQQKRPPALSGELVQDFVRKGHHDLPGLKAMLEE